MRPIRALLCLLPVFALISSVHAADYGPVKTGDSLWVIAKDHRPATNITINQMMIATFRSNPDAFGGNINWLYVAHMLELPDAAEVRKISVAEADAEVARQNAAWANAVDRFVSADGNRRRQLNTILSGQQSDDPEIAALREELRALVAGLKAENQELRSRLEQREPEETLPEIVPLETKCTTRIEWCLEVGIKTYLVSDPILAFDYEILSDALRLVLPPGPAAIEFPVEGQTPGPALGVYATRDLDWLPELAFRTGIEFVRYESTGLSDGFIGANEFTTPTGFAHVEITALTVPFNFRKSFPDHAFNRGRMIPAMTAGLNYNLVTDVSGVYSATGRPPTDYSDHLDEKSFLSLSVGGQVDWYPTFMPGVVSVELGYEKGLGRGFDGPPVGSFGSRIRVFRAAAFDSVTLNIRYGFR